MSASVEEVFDFFAEARNLELITPSFLRFRILTPNPTVRAGALLDYSLKLHGWPVRWRTRIEVFDPPSRFTDLQLSGPYRYWHHLHEFHQCDEGTQILDIVHYELPIRKNSLFLRVAESLVKRDLRTIFDYREIKVEDIFTKRDL